MSGEWLMSEEQWDAADGDRQQNLPKDLLEGAAEIAAFLFGDSARRRTIFHLAHSDELPIFRMGATICARRSTILAWRREREGELRSGQKD